VCCRVVFLSILSGASLMSQNTQQSPQRGTDLQSLPAVSDVDPLAQVATLKIVACPICRAVYVPSNEEQAATPGSTRLLETAFLEVCHFCFRCQRPACPQCWNPVHHTCASCKDWSFRRPPLFMTRGQTRSRLPASAMDGFTHLNRLQLAQSPRKCRYSQHLLRANQ
jgi:hypothetical protein